MTKAEFIKKFYPLANSSTRGTTIQPYLSLAVAALESRNGNSLLATKYNNYHGIKAGTKYKGKSVLMQTTEEETGETPVQARFRVYNTPLDSFKDFVNFLKVNPRYKTAIKLPTAHLQAQGLQTAGYATNKKYAASLQPIIAQITAQLGTKPQLGTNINLLGLTAFSLLLLSAVQNTYTNERRKRQPN